MKVVGEAPSLRPLEVAKVVMRALRVPWMWLGVGMMALAFFSLLGALAIYNVSFVVPVTALSYVMGAFGGVVFLREHVGFQRWLGVLLISIGVALVFLGKN
jgi:drug/metabolite transporter (DMT)-like permease